MPLLIVNDLRLTLPAQRSAENPAGVLQPVDGVSFSIEPGECVALVGESGCGKSLTASSITGLTRSLNGAKLAGEVLWAPSVNDASHFDLLGLPEAELRRVRGAQIAMVFQDPLSCLNPVLRIGYQLGEVLAQHMHLRGAAARRRMLELLESVGVSQPELRLRQYPHQLSGGLRQRVLLALALAGEPRLLIADEPTTALDVTIQAQVLETLRELQAASGLAILFITHDLGVVAQLARRVLVMYAGRIVEQAPAREFFTAPSHPYSQGLLRSLPAWNAARTSSLPADKAAALYSIPGAPPDPAHFPTGCRFHPRCAFCTEQCTREYPPILGDPPQVAACWHIERARENWFAKQGATVSAMASAD